MKEIRQRDCLEAHGQIDRGEAIPGTAGIQIALG